MGSMLPKKTLPAILATTGFSFFLLTSAVFFLRHDYDFSTILIVISFILSLLFSWAAVALLKFAREGGIIEIISWAIALLDSIISIALILMFLLGSGIY